MWDYDALTALGAIYPPSAVFLSGQTIVLAISALRQMEFRSAWENNGLPLTDAEEDVRDTIVSQAEYEITVESLSVVYAGTVLAYAGSTIPAGWLACDGASLLRSAYPALFAAIGTTWGTVDGTHFTLPNLKGRTVIGDGTGSGLSARTLGQTGGEENHQLNIPELPTHSHSIDVHNNGSLGTTTVIPASGNTVVNQQPVTNNTGSNTPHNNMQPYSVLKWIIATGQ